jgi:hypothetical protein
MATEFPEKDVSDLLAACHRRCCICHRFCGVKMEIDHIVPRKDGGTNSIENAIAVCFDCHAEIHHYNTSHPKGRRFRAEELLKHKEQWLKICKNRPELLSEINRNSNAEPSQALADELDFNLDIAKESNQENLGCLFVDHQYQRAINEGIIATLNDDLKSLIREAYRTMSRANQLIPVPLQHSPQFINYSQHMGAAIGAIEKARPCIEAARNQLLQLFNASCRLYHPALKYRAGERETRLRGLLMQYAQADLALSCRVLQCPE